MSNEQDLMRADFETAYRAEVMRRSGKDVDQSVFAFRDGEYVIGNVQAAFWGFQASRQQAVPSGFRVMKPTSAVRDGERWEIYAPCGSGGIVHEDDVTDWVVRNLLDAMAAAPQAEQQSPEFGAPYQGAREEMAIWKRRALEAEQRIREQDQIIDRLGDALNADNGPIKFGEPVMPQAEQVDQNEQLAFDAYAKLRFPIADRQDSLGAYSRDMRNTAREAWVEALAYRATHTQPRPPLTLAVWLRWPRKCLFFWNGKWMTWAICF